MTTSSASANAELVIPQDVLSHPAWFRLVDQLDWYDGKSTYCQKWYKRSKAAQIVCAVAIPVFALLPDGYAKIFTSFFGGIIAIIEAIQQMNQYSTLWVTYRATAEHLKHEKFLFLSMAGPYKNLSPEDRLVVLAERVEEHVSTEHANWFNDAKRCATSQARRGEHE